MPLRLIEVCAGAGGQALGLERAGFEPCALVEIEPDFANTLKKNRPSWNVYTQDLNKWAQERAVDYAECNIDLFSGGLPCPPFSIAGKQLGSLDERNLFPAAMKIIRTVQPKAILIENVKGFLGSAFEGYRRYLKAQLSKMGYVADWKLLRASTFGVPQLRPRVAIIGYRKDIADRVVWPEWQEEKAPTVGEVLLDLMGRQGWKGAERWAKRANQIAPTIVGGSKKHGGPDLGPMGAKQA